MLTFNQALKLILTHARPLKSETIILRDSFGRVTAQDILANSDIPSFDRVQMDGFAVRSQDLKGLPKIFPIIETLSAGNIAKKSIKKNQTIKVMTGCVLPLGADKVIKKEDTIEFNNAVKILRAPKDKYISFKGQDCKRGELLLEKGASLRAPEISILATCGNSRIKVYKQCSAAVLATGDEVVETDKKISLGRIYNSNSPMLMAMLKNLGVRIRYLGIAKDNIKGLTDKIKEGLKQDILIISGGVSMGDYDLVPKVLGSLKVKKIFHKVKIKPGKPLWLGKRNQALVFGVPGNPVSTLVSYLLFIKPAVLKMQGQKNFKPLFLSGKLAKDFKVNTGRLYFHPCKVKGDKVAANFHNDSADMKSVTESDGFLKCKIGNYTLKRNSKVEYIKI